MSMFPNITKLRFDEFRVVRFFHGNRKMDKTEILYNSYQQFNFYFSFMCRNSFDQTMRER